MVFLLNNIINVSSKTYFLSVWLCENANIALMLQYTPPPPQIFGDPGIVSQGKTMKTTLVNFCNIDFAAQFTFLQTDYLLLGI